MFEKIEKVTLGKTLGVYGLYSFLSMVLFLVTSGGWGIVSILVFLPFLYIGSGLIIVLLWLLLNKFKFRWAANRQIFRKLFIILITFQAFLILFNYGDRGDSPGAYNLIQRIIGGTYYGMRPYINMIIMMNLYKLYFVIVAVFFSIGVFSLNKNGK